MEIVNLFMIILGYTAFSIFIIAILIKIAIKLSTKSVEQITYRRWKDHHENIMPFEEFNNRYRYCKNCKDFYDTETDGYQCMCYIK